jgi:hypothetical protein
MRPSYISTRKRSIRTAARLAYDEKGLLLGLIGQVPHNPASRPRERAVKKEHFSVEQITSVLQQVAGGVPVGDVCR